jgi:hypothetical protein
MFGQGRPSPAMIVGVIALVFAIAGTAIAAPEAINKITKSKVKKIANKQITKAAPDLEVASATTAESADIARNIHSANVLASGEMLGSIPDGATSTRTALGTYEVTLTRSIAGCTISASSGSPTTSTPALVGVAPVPGEPDTLRVFTRTAANVVADEDFYVQAICPGG